MKKIKQISYLSALLISIGSTIGAGIFFKNGEIFSNVGGHLSFMITSWVVASIGILAIGLALVEMSSANKTGGGILEWVKKFTPKKFSKYSAGYMVLVFLPLNYFALPIYAALSLQDALGDNILGGWEVAAIAFGLFLWFAAMGYFQQRFSEITQWIFTIAKFIPLILVAILGMIHIEHEGAKTSIEASATGITGFSPWLGIIGSIPAILFAVDGFYTVSTLKPEMKQPKKLGSVIALSVSIIMGTYLFFAIILGIGGNQNHSDLLGSYPKWLGIFVNTFIVIAILGIVNGFAIAAPKMYVDTFNDQPIGIVAFTKKTFKVKKTEFAAWLTSVLVTFIYFIILIPIGIYGIDSAKTSYDYTLSAGGLYELTDLITSFTSMIIFSFIGVAIVGSLLNRKSNKVQVEKSNYHVVVSIIAASFIFIGGLYMFVNVFSGIFGVNNADPINSGIKFGVLIATTLIPCLPLIRDKIKNKATT